MCTRLTLAVGLLLGLAVNLWAQAPAPDALPADVLVGQPAASVRAVGKFAPAPQLVATAGQAGSVLVFGDAQSRDYRVDLQVLPVETGALEIMALPTAPEDFAKTACVGKVTLSRDREGNYMSMRAYRYDASLDKPWVLANALNYIWRPTRGQPAQWADDDNQTPERWTNQWLDLRVDVVGQRVTIWVQGLVAHSFALDKPAQGAVSVALYRGDQVRQVKVTAVDSLSRFEPVTLDRLAQGVSKKLVKPKAAQVNGVPFQTPSNPYAVLDLSAAGWVDQRRDPQSYYEHDDGGPYFLEDPRMPFLRVPRWDYCAMHLLAAADDDANKTNVLTVRAGRYGYSDQVLLRDFAVAVPRVGEAEKIDAAQRVATPAGTYYHVQLPMTEAFAQDLLDPFIEMQLTKEVHLARHVPDPNRFRYRPLGLPSGVKIIGLTLEKSPLQMRVGSGEPGHVFVSPQGASFSVTLTNITSEDLPAQLTAVATHLYGTTVTTQASVPVPAGQTVTTAMPLPLTTFGYYDLTLTLQSQERTLLTRRTSFALLPPDTRRHRDRNPYGAWDWKGGHVTSADPDVNGSLYFKMGFRYGMSHYTPEQRAKYQLKRGFETRLDPELKTLKRDIELHGSDVTSGLIFHETSLSGPHVTRVPDLFHDRTPYKLSAKEEKRYQDMLTEALESGRAARKEYPQLRIKFGNGPLTTKEEFYRRGFPAELFDAAGNEPGSFHRLPETQPPDYVANNASIWMDRQLLDAYGYKDKTVEQCYEVGYPGDNPGNLPSTTQADYFVRHFLHSLAWKMPFIHMGMINDAGNSYYFSNWGSTGFCRAVPEINPKPAYVALATMTLALDGASYVRSVPTASRSVYLLEFSRADGGFVYACWTLRGERPITLSVTGAGWRSMDDQGNSVDATLANGQLTVNANMTPRYVFGPAAVSAAELGAPVYADAPAAGSVVVDPLATLDGWMLLTERSAELESYNFMAPRRIGDFAIEPTPAFEGQQGMWRITPRPLATGKDTMSMYARLQHATGIELPGTPGNLGVWINGNSGWGRVIYELHDAGGQRWISLGMQAEGENRWLLDWLPADMMGQVEKVQIDDWNANDVYQVSRINFDGWRYVRFPLPGNYPFENHPRPDNCNWRYDGDGVVKYPLRLTGLVIELPEKVLHLQDWSPPARPEVYVRALTVEP